MIGLRLPFVSTRRARAWPGMLACIAALMLGGCAVTPMVYSDVTSYGEWPVGRTSGSYAFDRLPSQQAHLAESAALEASASGALARAGFTPAAPGQAADVLVQLGAVEGLAVPPWEDPLWWHGGFGPYWRRGPWGVPPWPGPGWRGRDVYYGNPRYAQAVAVLIRDRASGQPLYESHASTESVAPGDDGLWATLFDAALADFPVPGNGSRHIELPRQPGATVPAVVPAGTPAASSPAPSPASSPSSAPKS